MFFNILPSIYLFTKLFCLVEKQFAVDIIANSCLVEKLKMTRNIWKLIIQIDMNINHNVLIIISCSINKEILLIFYFLL